MQTAPSVPTIFEPDWAVPPGATISALLASHKLSRRSLADRIGESLGMVQRLLLGLEAIDDDLASRLAVCLGGSSTFWIEREKQFRADTARIKGRQDVRERQAWVKQFPILEMTSLGWINKFRSTEEDAVECLKFFDVPNVAAWQARYQRTYASAAFRISDRVQKKPGAITAWLRWAELVANRTPCEAWKPETFWQQLAAARRLTWQKDPSAFLPALRRLCAQAGVVVVVAPTPRGCPASGATRFLRSGNPMLVLSFRFRSDDHFWFTFFHEAAHLLLHDKAALFLEGEAEVTSEEEREANNFAKDLLIPPQYDEELAALKLDEKSVLRFARRVGVSPGIIVGQLQHLGRLAPDRLNRLKRRYKWPQIEVDRLIP